MSIKWYEFLINHNIIWEFHHQKNNLIIIHFGDLRLCISYFKFILFILLNLYYIILNILIILNLTIIKIYTMNFVSLNYVFFRIFMQL